MEKVKGVEANILIPLSKYRKLTTRSDKVQSNQKFETQSDQNIPEDLHLLMKSVQVHKQKTCLLLLEHLARLNGACAYDPATGEIILDKEKQLCGTNMCEVMRILLSNTRSSAQRTLEEHLGTCVIVNVFAKFTPLPASLITHPYWRGMLLVTRADNANEYFISDIQQ